MPHLRPNEVYKRRMISGLSELLELEPEQISAVLDGIYLYMMHDLFTKYQQESTLSGEFKVEIPMIGTVTLKGTDERLVPEIKMTKQFMNDAKQAYFYGKDPMLDRIESNFNRDIQSKFLKLLSESEDD